MGRQEYLRQMYLKNRGLLKDTTVSDLAYLDTSADSKNTTYTVNDLNLDNEIDKQSASSIDKGDWWQRTIGTINQLGANLLGGAISSIEGLTDGITNIAGYIGTWFGADDQWAKDASSYDWSSDVTNFLAKANDSIAPWNWGRLDQIWGDEDYQETINQQSWFSENDTLNSWVNNIESMVGNMLPSIALTYATAGAYAGASAGAVANGFKSATDVANTANKIGKWAGLLEMSLSAAGSSSVEALQNGAELSNALLYGALSGSVELGTELIGGEGVAGVLTKPMSDSLTKNLIKSFVSEGAEEVLSDLVSPLIDLTYKNNDSWESAINYLNEEYTSQDFAKGLVDSFVMGGIGGLIFGGASEIGSYRKYGKTGYSYVSTVNEVNEVKEKLEKARASGNETKIAKYTSELNELGNKLSNLATKIGSNTELQRKLAEQMGDYVELDEIENKLNRELTKIEAGQSTNTKEQAIQNATNEYDKAFKNITSRATEVSDQVIDAINDFTQKIKSKYGINVEVELQDNFEKSTGRSAQYQNGKIIIDSKYKNNVYPLLSHEVGHAVSENLDSSSTNEIYERMIRTGVAKQFEEQIKNTDNYKNAKTPELKRNILVKESISYYLESLVENENGAKETYLETSLLKKVFSPKYYKNLSVNSEIRKQLSKLSINSKYAQKVVNKYLKGERIFKQIGLTTTDDILKEVIKKVQKNNSSITAVELNILKSYLESGNATGNIENSSGDFVYAKEKSKAEILISDFVSEEYSKLFKDLKTIRENNNFLEEAADTFSKEKVNKIIEELDSKGVDNLKKSIQTELDSLYEQRNEIDSKKLKTNTDLGLLKKIDGQIAILENVEDYIETRNSETTNNTETVSEKEEMEEGESTNYSLKDRESIEALSNKKLDEYDIDSDVSDIISESLNDSLDEFFETIQNYKEENHTLDDFRDFLESELDSLSDRLKDDVKDETEDFEEKPKGYKTAINGLIKVIKNNLLVEESTSKNNKNSIEKESATKTSAIVKAEKKSNVKKTKTTVKIEAENKVEEAKKETKPKKTKTNKVVETVEKTTTKKTGTNFDIIEKEGKQVNLENNISKTKRDKEFHYNKTSQVYAKIGINYDGQIYDILPENIAQRYIENQQKNEKYKDFDSKKIKQFSGALSRVINAIQRTVFNSKVINQINDNVGSTQDLYNKLSAEFDEKIANMLASKYRNGKYRINPEFVEPISNLLMAYKEIIFAPRNILFNKAVERVEASKNVATTSTVETETTVSEKNSIYSALKKISPVGKQVNIDNGINESFGYNTTTYAFSKLGINFSGSLTYIIPSNAFDDYAKNNNFTKEQSKLFETVVHKMITKVNKVFKNTKTSISDDTKTNKTLTKDLKTKFEKEITKIPTEVEIDKKKVPVPKEISDKVLELLKSTESLIFVEGDTLFNKVANKAGVDLKSITSKFSTTTKKSTSKAKTSASIDIASIEAKLDSGKKLSSKEIKEINKKIASYETRIAELEKQKLTTDEYKTLKEEVANLKRYKEKNKNLKTTNNTLKRQKNRLENKTESQQEKLDKVNTELEANKAENDRLKQENKHIVENGTKQGKAAYQMEIDKKVLQAKEKNSTKTGKHIIGSNVEILKSKDTKIDVRYAENFTSTYQSRIFGIEQFVGNEFKSSTNNANKVAAAINQLYERIVLEPEFWDDSVRYDNFYNYFGNMDNLVDFLKMIDKYGQLINEYNQRVDSSEIKNKEKAYLKNYFELNDTRNKIVELVDRYAKYRKNGAGYGNFSRYYVRNENGNYSNFEVKNSQSNYVSAIQNSLNSEEKQKFRVSSFIINTEVESEIRNTSSEMYKLKNGINNDNMPLKRLDLNIQKNQILGTGVSTEALIKLYKVIVNYATLEQGDMSLKEYRKVKKELLNQIRRNLVETGALADTEKDGKKIVSPISKLINKVHNINYQSLKKNGSRELLIQLEKAKYVVDKILALEGINEEGKVVEDVNLYILNNYPSGVSGTKMTSPLEKVEFKRLSNEMGKLIENLRKEFGFEKGYTFVENEVFNSKISSESYVTSKNVLSDDFSYFPKIIEEINVSENTLNELGKDAPLVPIVEYELTSVNESKKEYIEEFLQKESEKVDNTPNSVQNEDIKDPSKKVMTENVDRTKTHESLSQFTSKLKKLGMSKGYIHDVISWIANHPMWLKFQKQWVNSQVYFERAVEKFGFNRVQSAEMTYRLRISDKVASYLVENGFEIVDGYKEDGTPITHKSSIYGAYSKLLKSIMNDESLSSSKKTEKIKKLKNKADLYMYNLYQIDNNEAIKKKVDYLLEQSTGDLFQVLSEFDIDPNDYFKKTRIMTHAVDQVFPENLKNAIDVDVRILQELIEEKGKQKGFTEARQLKAKQKVYDIMQSVKKGAEIKSVFGQIVDNKAIKSIDLEVLRAFSPELVSRIETSLKENGFVWNEDLGNYTPEDFGDNETVKNEYSKLKKLTRDFTNEELQKSNDAILREYPQVKEYQKELRETLDSMLEYRVKKGLVDSKVADNLSELYPNYVPTYREQISYTGSEKTLKGVNATNDIRTRNGSAQLISPLLQSMTNQTRSMVKKGTINDIANQIDTMAEISNTRNVESDIVLDTENRTIPKIYSIEELLEQIDKITPAEEENNNVTYYKNVNGELVEKRMTLTNDAMQAFQEIESENKFDNFILARAMKKGMNLFTNLVTSYNPFFLLRNASRDIGDAILTTQHDTTKFLKEYGLSYKEIVNNSEMYQLYRSLGGGVFDSYAGDSLTTLEEKFTNENSNTRKAKNFLGIANEIVEAAPRFTEFKLSYAKYLEAGMTKTEAANLAMLDAARITTDFSRGGTWGKSLNRVLIPFLNAQIQGASKVINFTKNSWLTLTHPKDRKEFVTLLAKLLLLGIAPELLSRLLNLGNEDYEALPEYTKAQYLCIPLWNGNFIKIPRGRIIGTLNNTVYQAMEIVKGNKNLVEGAKDWLDVASTNLAPVDLGSGIRTIFSPISDVRNNTTWYGQKIDNTSDLNKYGSQRYDASTSEIGKFIGKIFNYSPKRIDYLLESYTGVVGDILLPLATKSNYTDVGGTLMNFVTSNLSVNAVKNNRYRGESYELLQNLLYEKNAGSEVGTVQYNYLKRALDECKDLEEVVNQAETQAEQYTAYLTLREAYKQAISNTELIAQKLQGVSGIDTSDRYTMTELYHQMFGAEYALKYYNSTLGAKATIAKAIGINAETLYTAYFAVRGVSTTTEAKLIVNRLATSYYGRLWLKKAVGLSLTSAEETKLSRYLKVKGLSS